MLAGILDLRIMENRFMSKLLLSVLFVTMLIGNSAYAETTKSVKKTKSTDTNKTMSDEEFMKRFMALEQEEKDTKEKTIQVEKKLEETRKLRKTVDELANQLGIKEQ